MNKYLNKLLLLNIHSAEGEQEINHNAAFLNSVFFLAGVVAFGMGFVRWQESIVMGLIDFGFSGLCFTMLYYLRHHKEKIDLISSVALILSFMLFFAIYLLAPYNTTRMSLFFLLAASAIFLKGRKIGFYWLIFILLSIVAGHLIPYFDTSYSQIDILTTCVYLIALYIIFGNYETIKETQEELLKQHRNRLETDVAQRTVDLREANRLLEKELVDRKKTEEQKQNILDAVDEGFIIIDRNFRILSANRAYADQVKMTLEEIIGRHCYELSHHLTEPCADAQHPCSVRQVFDTGESSTAVHTHYDKAGKPLYVETKSYPLSKDATGNIITVIETITDITEQKRNAEEIVKARNLQSLGILAGGIAHDFNNLLQGLLGNIYMARQYIPETNKAFSFLKSAEESYSAAQGLTSQLLAFATGGVSLRKTISPNGLIRDAVSFTLSGSNVKVAFDMDNNLHSIHVDADQLRQVISNMVLNARDAMPTGGHLMVLARNVLIHIGDLPGLSPGPYVRISIKDNGQGIPQELLPRIFDPYFSTKVRGPQKGMGLGLTICDTIIRKHGGAISVESVIDKGTVFHIYLPAMAAEAVLSEPEEITSAVKGGARILIMDDEPAVYQVAEDYLCLSGYRVDSVIDGEAAINAYKAALQEADPYAAVILDLTIPGGMGGQEAMKRIRTIDPGVTAIVSSGYADDPVITDFAAYGFKKSLVKPYPLEILKETLDQIL